MRKGILFLMLSSLVLISLSTISLAQTQVAASSTYRGDINEDGQVNIFDLLGMLSMLSNPEGKTERARQIADIDESESVNIFDLLGMLQVLSGAGEPEVIYWGPAIAGLSWTIAAVGDTLVAYLENIDKATTISDVSLQINEQDVEILSFTQDSVGIIIPQWFAGGQLRLVVADDTTNSVLTLLYIPGLANSTSDSGKGSLRYAITSASPGDSITFDPSIFPPAGPDTIILASPLPALDQGGLVIDASDAGVVIDGSMISESEAFGFSIVSNNNVIRGLHIKDFSGAGIALAGGAQNNTIGGDRNIGEGPSGQGNMITCTVYFENVGIWCYGTSFNTIQGNFIGTDVGGTTSQGRFNHSIAIEAVDNLVEDNLIGGYVVSGVSIGGVSAGRNTIRGNYIGTDTSGMIKISHSDWYGVSIDNSGYNVVGPANVIAHNALSGIYIQGEESVGNRITQNSIYNNGVLGIELWDGELAAPAIFDFDLQSGTVTGVASANCTVEVFSDNAGEGEIYEGQTTADNAGIFSFSKGAPFTRSYLKATATDADGNTSRFSAYTPDVPTRTVILQEGNNLPKTRLQTKRSEELAENHIGAGPEINHVYDLGAKHHRVSLNNVEEEGVFWDISEFEIPLDLDDRVTSLAAHGVTTHMTLSFWDKANHPGGWTEPRGYSRFQTEEEIQRYLEFVQFIVNHFKDRIQYYEIWNEPEIGRYPLQYIKVPDYINLVKRVVPVIRQEYPEAKIMVGTNVLRYAAQNYLFKLLRSTEIMPLVDVINWHPFYGETPAYEETKDYYDQYPSLVQTIQDTAYAHGFRGEYNADEVSWGVEGSPHPSDHYYSEIQSSKYYARGIATHLGLDVIFNFSGPPPHLVTQYAVIRNLCTVMAGTTTDSVAIQIESDAAYLRSCSFSLPDGDKMIALWTDGVAVDDDPGVAATLTLPWQSAQSVKGIDVINGYEQQLISSVEDGNLVIRGFLVKDYPIFISIE
ncbi:dockerin type I domain-containing protein [Gemmatimonadota bacterium]